MFFCWLTQTFVLLESKEDEAAVRMCHRLRANTQTTHPKHSDHTLTVMLSMQACHVGTIQTPHKHTLVGVAR